jgi:Flp pilus assembly protein TadG
MPGIAQRGGASLRARFAAALAPGNRERGNSSIELVLLLPLLFLFIVGAVQLALYLSAANAAKTAASQALAIVKAQGGTAAQGQAQASAALTQMTGSTLKDTTVTVARDGTEATVTISGQAISVFAVPIHITQVVHGPIERLYHR